MSDRTLQLAKTIQAFRFNSDYTPNRLDSDMIADHSITNGKLVDSEITINGIPVTLGGSITIHGGGGNNNNSQLSYSVNPTEIEFETGSTQTVRVGAIGITSGYTINSVSVQVRDQQNAVIHTQTTTDAFTFSIPRTPAGTASISVNAHVTRTSDGATYIDERDTTIHINYGWYAGRLNPGNVGDLTNQGVWDGNTNFTAPAGTGRLYVALPNNHTAGYVMLDGEFRLFIPSGGTTFDTNWFLYSTDEAAAGTVYRIEEA